MKLKKSAPWYNPYYIEGVQHTYSLNNIIIFEGGKKLYETNKGWFTYSNNDIETVEFPNVEVKRKIKEDLNVNFPYYIKDVLYLPASLVNFKFLERTERKDGKYSKKIYDHYTIVLNGEELKMSKYVDTIYNKAGVKLLEVAKILNEELRTNIGLYTMEGLAERLNIEIK